MSLGAAVSALGSVDTISMTSSEQGGSGCKPQGGGEDGKAVAKKGRMRRWTAKTFGKLLPKRR